MHLRQIFKIWDWLAKVIQNFAVQWKLSSCGIDKRFHNYSIVGSKDRLEGNEWKNAGSINSQHTKVKLENNSWTTLSWLRTRRLKCWVCYASLPHLFYRPSGIDRYARLPAAHLWPLSAAKPVTITPTTIRRPKIQDKVLSTYPAPANIGQKIPPHETFNGKRNHSPGRAWAKISAVS